MVTVTAAEADPAPVPSLKIAGDGDVKKIAGAMCGVLREAGTVRAVVMGPRSLNQMVKALAIARPLLAREGRDLTASVKLVHVKSDQRAPDDDDPDVLNAVQATMVCFCACLCSVSVLCASACVCLCMCVCVSVIL